MAQLCGLSATWYTWLEQGRDISVSPPALVRLAEALRLGRAERSYLFDLAGNRDTDPDRGNTDSITPAVLACVDEIAAPAYVLDSEWNARVGMHPHRGCSPAGSMRRANAICFALHSASRAREH